MPIGERRTAEGVRRRGSADRCRRRAERVSRGLAPPLGNVPIGAEPTPSGPLGIARVAFSRDGRRLLVGHADGWGAFDVATSRSIARDARHPGAQAVALSPDGTRVATVTDVGMMQIVDALDGDRAGARSALAADAPVEDAELLGVLATLAHEARSADPQRPALCAHVKAPVSAPSPLLVRTACRSPGRCRSV